MNKASFEETVRSGVTRRSFVKGFGVAGMATIVSSGLAGCASPNSNLSNTAPSVAEDAIEYPGVISEADFQASSVEREPITEFADEATYDVVVVGAGVAGIPAVLTALDEGATVGCLQKESAASANGHYEGSLVLEESDPNDILIWQQSIRANNGYRVNWDLLSYYAAHSGETSFFLDKCAERIGMPADETWITEGVDLTEGSSIQDTNKDMRLLYTVHGWRVGNDGLVKALAEQAAQDGAVFYYNTPGVQLLQDASGAVTGVIGKSSDGYIKLNATKGVILATGDYESNESMLGKFIPSASRYEVTQTGRTGDGHLMAIQAGAHMVPSPHACQMHCVFASDWHTSGVPLLSLNMKGERFMNEEIAMTLWHNSCDSLTDQEDPGLFVRVFDDAFETKMAEFDFGTRDMLEAYIPENNVENYTGVTNWTPAFADVHKADTLEELADILGVPADALAKSVEQWNEYCAAGEDPEYGVSARYLKSIDTPPYWGVNQHVRVIATNAGVEVDGNYQVVDESGAPIPGLFAVGTTGGNVCGNIDWRMSFGLSNSHCMTAGRYSVLYALYGKNEPTKPAQWDEVRHLYSR